MPAVIAVGRLQALRCRFGPHWQRAGAPSAAPSLPCSREQAIAQIRQRPEVVARQHYIDSLTHHQSGLTAIDYAEGSPDSNPYYEIHVGYSSEIRFKTFFIFRVDKATCAIRQEHPSLDALPAPEENQEQAVIPSSNCYDYLTELVRSSTFPFRAVHPSRVNILIDDETPEAVSMKLFYDTDGTGTLGWARYEKSTRKLFNTSADLEAPVSLTYDARWARQYAQCAGMVPASYSGTYTVTVETEETTTGTASITYTFTITEADVTLSLRTYHEPIRCEGPYRTRQKEGLLELFYAGSDASCISAAPAFYLRKKGNQLYVKGVGGEGTYHSWILLHPA